MFLFGCLFHVRPWDFIKSVHGQTCHGCINHGTVIGLCSDLLTRLSFYIHRAGIIKFLTLAGIEPATTWSCALSLTARPRLSPLWFSKDRIKCWIKIRISKKILCLFIIYISKTGYSVELCCIKSWIKIWISKRESKTKIRWLIYKKELTMNSMFYQKMNTKCEYKGLSI